MEGILCGAALRCLVLTSRAGVLRAMVSLPDGDLWMRWDNWNLPWSTSPFARTFLVLRPSENSVQPRFAAGAHTSLLNGAFHTLLSTRFTSLSPDTLTSLFIHSRGHSKPDRSWDLPKAIQLTTDKGGGRSGTGYGSAALLCLPDIFLREGDCAVQPNRHKHLALSLDEDGASLVSQWAFLILYHRSDEENAIWPWITPQRSAWFH